MPGVGRCCVMACGQLRCEATATRLRPQTALATLVADRLGNSPALVQPVLDLLTSGVADIAASASTIVEDECVFEGHGSFGGT